MAELIKGKSLSSPVRMGPKRQVDGLDELFIEINSA